MNEVYARYFTAAPPRSLHRRSCAAYPKDALVEIDLHRSGIIFGINLQTLKARHSQEAEPMSKFRHSEIAIFGLAPDSGRQHRIPHLKRPRRRRLPQQLPKEAHRKRSLRRRLRRTLLPTPVAGDQVPRRRPKSTTVHHTATKSTAGKTVCQGKRTPVTKVDPNAPYAGPRRRDHHAHWLAVLGYQDRYGCHWRQQGKKVEGPVHGMAHGRSQVRQLHSNWAELPLHAGTGTGN